MVARVNCLQAEDSHEILSSFKANFSLECGPLQAIDDALALCMLSNFSWPIVHIEGSQVKLLKNCISFSEDQFDLAISVGPDEMHYSALHLGLYCFSKASVFSYSD